VICDSDLLKKRRKRLKKKTKKLFLKRLSFKKSLIKRVSFVINRSSLTTDQLNNAFQHNHYPFTQQPPRVTSTQQNVPSFYSAFLA